MERPHFKGVRNPTLVLELGITFFSLNIYLFLIYIFYI